MHDFPGFVLHKDQHIEWFEEEAVYDRVIASPDLMGMVLEEGSPILAARFLSHLFQEN